MYCDFTVLESAAPGSAKAAAVPPHRSGSRDSRMPGKAVGLLKVEVSDAERSPFRYSKGH